MNQPDSDSILPSAPVADADDCRKRILVVDDSFIMRRLVKDIVDSDSDLHVVDTADNGKEALIKVRQLKPDLVLLDIEMPEMSGLETLRRLGLRSSCKVVIVSSLGEEGSSERAEAFRLGAADVIPKPSGSVSLDIKEKRGSEIVRTVRRILGLPELPDAAGAPAPGTDDTAVLVPETASKENGLLQTLHTTLMAALDSGVIAFDMGGKVISANQKAGKILRQPELVAGTSTIGSVFTDFNESIGQDIREVIATGMPHTSEDTEYAADDDNWIPLRLSIQPLPGPARSAAGALLLFNDITHEKEMHRVLAKTVSSAVAGTMMSGSPSALGGAIKRSTILFSDVRGFTNLSEALGPSGIVALLNEYFSFMADIVRSNGGMIDKYIGDAIMALFGVPEPFGDDADRAVKTAIGMLDALDLLNQQRAREGQLPVHIGIGLATGDVLAGNIGSSDRMNYTVIGDAVNLAARIESQTKNYGASLLICDITRNALKVPVTSRKIDVVRVKGQTAPSILHQVFQKPPGAQQQAWLQLFDAGFNAYLDGDWATALRDLHAALDLNHNDKAAKLLIERCTQLQLAPPEKWEGVYTLTDK